MCAVYYNEQANWPPGSNKWDNVLSESYQARDNMIANGKQQFFRNMQSKYLIS